ERKNVAEAETLERRAQRRTGGCSHRSPTNAEGCLRSFRVRAVMDAARCERAALFGVSEGGPKAPPAGSTGGSGGSTTSGRSSARLRAPVDAATERLSVDTTK